MEGVGIETGGSGGRLGGANGRVWDGHWDLPFDFAFWTGGILTYCELDCKGFFWFFAVFSKISRRGERLWGAGRLVEERRVLGKEDAARRGGNSVR
jgi:hypothetical protein